MELDDAAKQSIKDMLGYTDEELGTFLGNPRNVDVLAKFGVLANKTIIAEVIESHGCLAGYRVGDKLVCDGGGNLITKLCPKRICPYAITTLATLLFTVQELVYAGADPNDMRFKRAGCPDVGLGCGGWGHVVFEVRVEDRT